MFTIHDGIPSMNRVVALSLRAACSTTSGVASAMARSSVGSENLFLSACLAVVLARELEVAPFWPGHSSQLAFVFL